MTSVILNQALDRLLKVPNSKINYFIMLKEIIIFMTSCKLVIGNYKGSYNANI